MYMNQPTNTYMYICVVYRYTKDTLGDKTTRVCKSPSFPPSPKIKVIDLQSAFLCAMSRYMNQVHSNGVSVESVFSSPQTVGKEESGQSQAKQGT